MIRQDNYSKYIETTLPNGGKLYYVKNEINKATSIKITFPSGARCETIPGLAHFVEHMFFTGTEEYNKDEITKKYFGIKSANANTGWDQICFYCNISIEELTKYLDLVAMLITKSTFTSEAVEKEKGVVLQEINLQKGDIDLDSWYFNRYHIYGIDCAKYTTVGTNKTVSKIKSKDVIDFVKKYFVANNVEIFVTSPLSLTKIKKLIIEHFESKLPIVDNFTKLPVHYLNVKNKEFYKVNTNDSKKNYIFLNFSFDRTIFDIDFKRKLGLVLDMLNNMSMGIDKYLRINKSLVYGSNSGANYFEHSSLLVFDTSCDRANIKEIIFTLADYFKDLVKNGFTEEQLSLAKHSFEYYDMIRTPKLNEYIDILYQFRYYGKIVSKKNNTELVKKITLEECNEVIREIFTNPKFSLSIYGDALEKDLPTKAEIKKLFK